MTSSAQRYAGVLFEVATDRDEVEAVSEGLEWLVRLVREVDEFRSIWLHPVLGGELKMEILDPVLEDLDSLVRDFTALLVQRSRESILEDIRDAYEDMCLQARGITRVQAYSAQALDEDTRGELARGLSRLGYEEVVIDERHDPSLLGGLMVRIGDLKIDGSLRRRLDDIDEALSRDA